MQKLLVVICGSQYYIYDFDLWFDIYKQYIICNRKIECMFLFINKVEKFVVSGKFKCVYFVNLVDGSIIEY